MSRTSYEVLITYNFTSVVLLNDNYNNNTIQTQRFKQTFCKVQEETKEEYLCNNFSAASERKYSLD